MLRPEARLANCREPVHSLFIRFVFQSFCARAHLSAVILLHPQRYVLRRLLLCIHVVLTDRSKVLCVIYYCLVNGHTQLSGLSYMTSERAFVGSNVTDSFYDLNISVARTQKGGNGLCDMIGNCTHKCLYADTSQAEGLMHEGKQNIK